MISLHVYAMMGVSTNRVCLGSAYTINQQFILWTVLLEICTTLEISGNKCMFIFYHDISRYIKKLEHACLLCAEHKRKKNLEGETIACL